MRKLIYNVLVIVCTLTLTAIGQHSVAVSHSQVGLKYLQQDSSNQDSVQNRRPQIYFETPGDLSTSSTSSISGEDIKSVPVTSYPLALSGRLAGLKVTQSSGEPLAEGFNISLRNQSPLILIDGIPRSLTEIGMEEIESVTVLKDAVATAMLGIRGAAGAIAVTTKKGFVGKQQVNFNIQTGLTRSTDNLISAPLDAYRYAMLYNEALTNDGLPVENYGFSNIALGAFQSGSDPLLYPNVDWREAVLESSAPLARYNVNTRGGNRFVKYFVSLEHFSQDGILKTSELNKYNTNSGLKGYFIRSNADMQLTDKLSAGIYIQGRILNTNSPGNSGTAGIFSSLLNTPSSAYPISNADGSYAGTSRFQNNIVAQNIASGYSLSNTRTVLSDFYLKRAFGGFAQGLWVKARASFFSNLNERVVRNKGFAVYESVNGQYRKYGTDGNQVNNNSINFQNRSDFQELSVGYSKSFTTSGLDVTLLANRDNLVNGSNLAYTIQGFSGHAAYNYKQKYLAEFSFAYNGANRYPDDGGFKYGFFPAAGLGWNISKEAFLQNWEWLDNLKLFGSYGRTGQDNGGYYLYQQVYNASPTSYFGSSAGTVTTVGESYLANPDQTWEKVDKLNAGLEAAFLKNRMSLVLTYYSHKFRDINIVRGTSSGLLGISYPSQNIGREVYKGFETEISWHQNGKKAGYRLGLNASLQNSELLYNAEVNQQYEWMRRSGQPVGMRFGYVSEGLFRSDEEIAGHAAPEGYMPQPGDIKYKDLNADGIINQYDQTAIGNKKPAVLLGATIAIRVANFDFSALLQAQTNREVYLSGSSYWEFQNSGVGQAYVNQLNRWTPQTAATATYPRLSTGTGPREGSVNNSASSSFWLRNGNYMRLKTVELGFKLPSALTKKANVPLIRLYVNALNPLTFSSESFDGADPENYSGSYPIQKVFTVGINAQL